ncbi:MAG: lysophospholipid acyltransferase family protein [Desulfobacterales bacterium]|nr:lysophospholipid acyltransferase family protein [Desulfobacterales bacterium]MBF0395458.1 lysophospholipid acyltransferase family protein [Desulfobacterales bacterium]
MNYTIFDTPVIRPIMRFLSLLILKFFGWRVEGKLPDIPKFVMIAAPHTSNWDLPLTLLVAFALKAKIYWMGKAAIFNRPFTGFFKWLGGIPIDRSKSNGVVKESIKQFEENEKLILTIPPSGTRRKVLYWKTGFYYIACGANVPIVLGFLDYSRKTGGIGYSYIPTGDIKSDFLEIQAFYSDIKGKYSLKSADILVEEPKAYSAQVFSQ